MPFWTQRPQKPPFEEPPGPDPEVEQTTRLLGPYRVNFNTVGIDATGGDPTTFANGGFVQVDELPDGCVVMAGWTETVTLFGDTGSVEVCVQPSDDPDNSSVIGLWSNSRSINPATTGYAIAESTQPQITFYARVVSGCALSVAYNGTPPIAGALDVYALIAEF